MNGITASHSTPNSGDGPLAKVAGAASVVTEKALPSLQNAAKSVSSGGNASDYPVPHPSGAQLADYVLVFQHIAKKYLRAKLKVPTTERAQIAAEYDKLLQRLRSTGLQVTSREGAKDSGQLLLFVRADDQLIDQMAKQEALSDYLHGVLSVEPPPQRSSSLSGSQKASPNMTPSSRVRLVDALITLPDIGSSAVQQAGGQSKLPSGAGLRLGLPEFPHLVDMTPIHDPEYNKAWVGRWSHTSPAKIMSGVGLSDLDSIREHFGEDVALYFGFLNYYFQALAPLAAWGASFWLLGKPFSPMYSFGLVVWACLAVELWRMKERKLAVRWGTLGVASVDRRRHDFVPREKRTDPATEEPEEVFEWWRRELRVILSLPVVALFASALAATMTLMFVVEIFVTQLYHGPGKQAVPFIPTALLVVAIPQIMAAWQATAVGITRWENHYSSKSYDYSLTLKRFAMQAITAYGALTLSAYVYIPFGEMLMQTMVERGFFHDSIQKGVQEGTLSPKGIDFHINPDRMHTQLFAVSVTSQIVNAFTELALPVIMRKFFEWKQERSEHSAAGKSPPSSGDVTPVAATDAAGEESERRFVSRVKKELALPPYDLFGDYAEMATQFGYVTLWSVVWPLSPVMGFVNNFFELRSDAAKICLNNRRPVPVRAETIGPWLEVFGFTAWMAALNNAALVYLFQQSADARLPGHSTYETTLRTHLHPPPATGFTTHANATTLTGGTDAQSLFSFTRLLPKGIPTSGPAGAVVAALLVALTAEHVYGLLRTGVRHILERLIWRGSTEEMLVRRREWAMRVSTVKSHMHEHESSTAEKTASAPTVTSPSSGFWASDRDVGAQVIRNADKTQ